MCNVHGQRECVPLSCVASCAYNVAALRHYIAQYSETVIVSPRFVRRVKWF